MKVLIVDDNAAILEIISDILKVDGYVTDTAEDLETARDRLDSFRPDVLILDSTLHGESSFPILGEISPDSDLKVLVLTSGNETLPKDSKFICGSLQSPYRSSDVLEKVRYLCSPEKLPQVQNTSKKETKKRRFGRRKKDRISHVDDTGLYYGKSYVIFDDTPDQAYRLAFAMAMQDNNVLVVTDENVKSVTERFISGNITVKGLTMRPRPGYLEISRPGSILEGVMDFIKENPRPVVVFSNIDILVQVNGMNRVLTMLHQIKAGADKQVSLIVSSDGEEFTGKDKDFLTSKMELYNHARREYA